MLGRKKWARQSEKLFPACSWVNSGEKESEIDEFSAKIFLCSTFDPRAASPTFSPLSLQLDYACR